MHKLKLELDLLAVESFETLRTGATRGTVEAFLPTRVCNTEEFSCVTCFTCANSCAGTCDGSCAYSCQATCYYTCDDASCATCLTNCGQESCVYVCP